MHIRSFVLITVAAVGLTACASRSAPVRNAALGGAIGAAAGYYAGCREQGGCFIGGREVGGSRYYDCRERRRYRRDDGY